MFSIGASMDSHIRDSFSREELNFMSESDIYISGGTGFTGTWIISILHSLFKIDSAPLVTVITRSPSKARTQLFNYPKLEIVDWRYLSRKATRNTSETRAIGFHTSVPAASGKPIRLEDVKTYSSQTEIFATWLGASYVHPVFVNLSSGTVYQRPTTGRIPETAPTMKTLDLTPYDVVKFSDEKLINELTDAKVINGVNPRLFSFTGPGINLPGNFAVGSFLNDALRRQAVLLTGNENSMRSYMSPIDMGIWLLKASIYPTTDNIHIGSPTGFKMSEIAHLISKMFGNGQITIQPMGGVSLESYVPETSNTEKRLRINTVIDLPSSFSYWGKQLG